MFVVWRGVERPSLSFWPFCVACPLCFASACTRRAHVVCLEVSELVAGGRRRVLVWSRGRIVEAGCALRIQGSAAAPLVVVLT